MKNKKIVPDMVKNDAFDVFLEGTEPNQIDFGDVVVTQSLGRPFAAPWDADVATQREFLWAAGRAGQKFGLED